MKSHGNLKNLLINAIRDEIGREDKVAILFSGGTDSLTCLFSCLELNLKPTLHTFYLEGNVSEDYRMSKKVAEFYDLNLVTTVIPRNEDHLVNDIYNIIKTYEIFNKIRLQILYPFLHVIPRINEKIVITGLSADTLYGTNYHTKMKYLENFQEIRKQFILTDEVDGYNALTKMVKKYDKKLVAPYRNKKVINFFLKHSWDQLNTPIQKNLSINAFKKYFDSQKIYRESSSLVLNSGISKWHDVLIKSKINKYKRETLDEIFSDIYHGRVTLD